MEQLDNANMAGLHVHFDFSERCAMNAAGLQLLSPLAVSGNSGGGQCGAGLFPTDGLSAGAQVAVGKRDLFRFRVA
jgi:hypothetical protein